MPLPVLAAMFAAVMGTIAVQGGASQPRPVVWNNPNRAAIVGVTHHVLKSASMGTQIGYNVYLPPAYDSEPTRRFPVVYFLHGAGGDENSDAGGFSGMLRREIDAGHIPPVICVFPNGGMSGYRDNAETKILAETMITRELIPEIDGSLRTIASSSGRSICGFSMGGGGAIRLALGHPELFCAAASWAGALAGRGGVDSSPNSAIALAKANYDKLYGHVRLLLIVGDKDMTYAAHPAFLATLNELKLPYTFHMLTGVDHNLGAYHTQTGAELIRFVTESFTKVNPS